MPHAMGPRAKISLAMASAPWTWPNSATVALGYSSMAPQWPPLAVKVEQVRQTFSGLQVVSAALQKPSVDSLEHARYGLQVSKATPWPLALMSLIHE